MHILVTGGTGLIGRNFIKSFPDNTYTVLTRNPKIKFSQHGVKLIHKLSEIANLNDFDAVLNLAGEPLVGTRWTNKQKVRIRDSRIDTSQQLVNLFNQSDSPPQVFVSGSAIGVYGNVGDRECLETQPIIANDNDFAQKLCRDWENTVSPLASKTRLVLLRTGIVLSQEGGALAKMLPAFYMAMGGRLGRGDQVMSWIHITDMVRAIDHVLNHTQIVGPVNLVAPEPVSNREFTQSLARALRRPAVVPMPEWLLHLLFGQASQLLLDSQNVVPKALDSADFQFFFTKLAPALKDLCAKQ